MNILFHLVFPVVSDSRLNFEMFWRLFFIYTIQYNLGDEIVKAEYSQPLFSTKLEILTDRNINKLQQIKFYIYSWIILDP